MPRTREQIRECQCCYNCWLLTRADGVAARALLVLKLDDRKTWCEHLTTLTHLIGGAEAKRRLAGEMAIG